jgi:aspartyl-tRNA(Asn)/glutamyl-tRNA(Gln) amidotransferase subunit C
MPAKTIVSKKDLEHIASLARIELTEDEKEKFAPQLTAILEYFGMLDEVKTDEQPLHHVFELTNIFREDEEGDSLPQDSVLGNAPKKEDGYIKGPRIV